MGRKIQPLLVVTAVLALFIIALIVFPRVLITFFLAFFLAFVIEPLVKWFERKGARRLTAVITVFFLMSVFGLVLAVNFLPGLLDDLNQALTKLPTYVKDLQSWFTRLNKEYKRFALPQNVREVVDEALYRGEAALRQFLLRLASLLLSFFSQVLFLLLVPVLAFYFSKDMENLKAMVYTWSKRLFGEEREVVFEVIAVVSGYLRAQALSSLVVGLLLTIGLLFLQVDLAILIGALAGVFNLIPYFGPVVGAFPAVLLATQASLWRAAYVIILFFIVNQIESIVIVPRLIGGRVGLNPLVIIFLLLIGGELFGFSGIVFAVPVGAVLQVLLKYYCKKVLFSSE
ncbi:MAG TPA: AI-2E family transporter [Hydrogenispora sp.]|jgi:predicted PurR-regulated permease PerM|nr:AI-2E family transporter [Hydrogenispora sp.]